jgi:hypothetical protein
MATNRRFLQMIDGRLRSMRHADKTEIMDNYVAKTEEDASVQLDTHYNMLGGKISSAKRRVNKCRYRE